MDSVCRLLCDIGCVLVFFCKQKTEYEMRISDWSSDVCSSDLASRADQTRRGGGGSGVSGGPMISARSGRSPSGIGGRSGAAIVPARQLDGGTQPMQRCAGIALAGAVGASEIAGA